MNTKGGNFFYSEELIDSKLSYQKTCCKISAQWISVTRQIIRDFWRVDLTAIVMLLTSGYDVAREHNKSGSSRQIYSSIARIYTRWWYLCGQNSILLQNTNTTQGCYFVLNWNHFEMTFLNLRINFYLLRTFFFILVVFVLFLLSLRFGQISPLAFFR